MSAAVLPACPCLPCNPARCSSATCTDSRDRDPPPSIVWVPGQGSTQPRVSRGLAGSRRWSGGPRAGLASSPTKKSPEVNLQKSPRKDPVYWSPGRMPLLVVRVGGSGPFPGNSWIRGRKAPMPMPCRTQSRCGRQAWGSIPRGFAQTALSHLATS
jgi:hypothetical protein